VSVQTAKDLLCGKDWAAVTGELQAAFNMSDIQAQVDSTTIFFSSRTNEIVFFSLNS
jgi:hypothetical protein